MPEFIKGLQLAHDFYFEIVAPLLEDHFSDVRYSAGRLCIGSDVPELIYFSPQKTMKR